MQLRSNESSHPAFWPVDYMVICYVAVLYGFGGCIICRRSLIKIGVSLNHHPASTTTLSATTKMGKPGVENRRTEEVTIANAISKAVFTRATFRATFRATSQVNCLWRRPDFFGV